MIELNGEIVLVTGGLGDSGHGCEGGREGIEEFLHDKLVSQSPG
jgi:acyl-CoA reductase-like NAD-dependent aldehyde dehydrogenase